MDFQGPWNEWLEGAPGYLPRKLRTADYPSKHDVLHHLKNYKGKYLSDEMWAGAIAVLDGSALKKKGRPVLSLRDKLKYLALSDIVDERAQEVRHLQASGTIPKSGGREGAQETAAIEIGRFCNMSGRGLLNAISNTKKEFGFT